MHRPLLPSSSGRAALFWGLVCCLLGGARVAAEPAASDLQVAAFSCDVTPPLGHPLCGGWIRPLAAVDDPLLAKGIILSARGKRYVLCAVDWCLLQTGAYETFRRKLAAAAGVPESQVSVHTVHQHNAPIADANAERILQGTAMPPAHLNLGFLDSATDRLAAAVREAGGHLEPFTHVGCGEAKVQRFASNRRVLLADGQIHARYSATQDPDLRAAPEGLIDPWLKTITLFQGDRPLVRLHYYATHPMSYYGDGRATSDTVGLARARLEREEGVPQIYFTGCAGNISAGKYNDGSPQARAELTERIYQAMKAAAAATQRAPVHRLDWRTARVRLSPRTEPEWSAAASRRMVANTNATALQRITAALNLAWLERLVGNPEVEISSLKLGPVTTLQLPGEAFIEYQLYAESLRPGDFLAVAAYGESGPGYICLDADLAAGGYEPTESRVGPPSEFALKRGIARLLQPARPAKPPFYADKRHLLEWRDAKGLEHPVRNVREWEKRRAHILAAILEVAGEPPRTAPQTPLEVQVIAEQTLPEFTRRQITFVSEPGDRVPAYLLIPRRLAAKAPAMLCLHQTVGIGKREPAGLGGSPNLQYAAELARRGYVTLAPDYPGFGDYRCDPYAAGYASTTMKGIWNHRRAVDLLASLPEVDAARMGAIGHSLGGHNALFLAAFEPRIRAVVTSCGFNSFFDYGGGDLTGWSHAGYMPRIATVFGNDPRRMPFDFTEVLAALAPRPVFINAPKHDANFEISGVKDCVSCAAPVYRLLGAAENLTTEYPDCGHDFPPEARQAAYAWLDRQLKPGR